LSIAHPDGESIGQSNCYIHTDSYGNGYAHSDSHCYRYVYADGDCYCNGYSDAAAEALTDAATASNAGAAPIGSGGWLDSGNSRMRIREFPASAYRSMAGALRDSPSSGFSARFRPLLAGIIELDIITEYNDATV
jgi:hypothetical protein